MSFLVLQLNPYLQNQNQNQNQGNMYSNMGIGGGTLANAYNQGTANAMLGSNAPVGYGPSPEEIARQEQMERKRKQNQTWNTANQAVRGVGTGLEVASKMFGQGAYDPYVGMKKPGLEYQHIAATNIPIVDLLISGGASIGKHFLEKAAYEQGVDRRGFMDTMGQQQVLTGNDYTSYAKHGKYHNPYKKYAQSGTTNQPKKPKEVEVIYNGNKALKAKLAKQRENVLSSNFQSKYAGMSDKQRTMAIERDRGMRGDLTDSQGIEMGGKQRMDNKLKVKKKGSGKHGYHNPYTKQRTKYK